MIATQRILKFRAYCPKLKKYLYPYPEGFYIVGETTVFDCIKQYHSEEGKEQGIKISVTDYFNIVVEQFTGLYDCTTWEELTEKERGEWTKYHMPSDWKGKAVYEGDILDVDNKSRLVKVIWHKQSASFDTVPIKIFNNEKFLALDNSSWSYRCKKLYTIHENPELLK